MHRGRRRKRRREAIQFPQHPAFSPTVSSLYLTVSLQIEVSEEENEKRRRRRKDREEE